MKQIILIFLSAMVTVDLIGGALKTPEIIQMVRTLNVLKIDSKMPVEAIGVIYQL